MKLHLKSYGDMWIETGFIIGSIIRLEKKVRTIRYKDPTELLSMVCNELVREMYAGRFYGNTDKAESNLEFICNIIYEQVNHVVKTAHALVLPPETQAIRENELRLKAIEAATTQIYNSYKKQMEVIKNEG